MPNLKQWPTDGSPVRFDDLLTPCRNALWKGEYQGYDIGERDKACCLSPDETLSPEGLDRARERGQDRAAVVLSVAIQLGIEQGRRLKMQEVERLMRAAIRDQQFGEAADLLTLLSALQRA